MLEKNINDFWNVNGDRELSDTWTDSTRFTVLHEKPPDGYTWSGGRLTKKTNDLQTRHFVAWDFGKMCPMRRNAKKSESGRSRNQSSTMPEDCVVCTSLIKLMKNSRTSWRLRVESWKFRYQPQCLANFKLDKYTETCRVEKDCKTKHAGIVEAGGSSRKRMEGSLHKYHEDRIAGKGMNLLSLYNLVRKFILMPQEWKYQMQRQQWTKIWEKLDKILAETKMWWSLQETKAVTKLGHTISIYLQITCCTWRRSPRSWDKDMVSARRIKCRTSMWTQLYGVYLCLSLFKLQCILVKSSQKFYDLPRINPRNLWHSYFKWMRGGSRIRQKLLGNCQKLTSFLTQCRVWEASVLNQSKHEKERLKGFWQHVVLKDVDRIDGEPMELEWNMFQGFTTLRILDEIQKVTTEAKCEPEHFKGRIIFMSMYNDFDGRNDETKKIELRMLSELLSMLEDSRKDIGPFLGPGSEKKWYGTHVNKPDGEWSKTSEGHDAQFCRKRTSCISCQQRLGKRRTEKQRKRERTPFTSTVVMTPLNWFFAQSSVSAEQWRIYVWRISQTLTRYRGNKPQMRIWNQWWYRQNFLLLTLFLRLMPKHNESCCVNTSRNSQNFLKNRNWPNSAPVLVSRKNVGKGQFFITLDDDALDDLKGSCREYTLPRSEESSRVGGWNCGKHEDRSSPWMWRSVMIKDVAVLRSWSNLYFETEQFLGFASWTESTNTWTRRGTRSSSRRTRRTLFSNPSSRWLNTRWCGSWKWFGVYFRRIHLSPSCRTQSQTVHAERRINSCSVKVHWRYQNGSYKLGCYARKPHGWLLEYRWMKRFVWFLDR